MRFLEYFLLKYLFLAKVLVKIFALTNGASKLCAKQQQLRVAA
jgi:hypothetical protein